MMCAKKIRNGVYVWQSYAQKTVVFFRTRCMIVTWTQVLRITDILCQTVANQLAVKRKGKGSVKGRV